MTVTTVTLHRRDLAQRSLWLEQYTSRAGISKKLHAEIQRAIDAQRVAAERVNKDMRRS